MILEELVRIKLTSELQAFQEERITWGKIEE